MTTAAQIRTEIAQAAGALDRGELPGEKWLMTTFNERDYSDGWKDRAASKRAHELGGAAYKLGYRDAAEALRWGRELTR